MLTRNFSLYSAEIAREQVLHLGDIVKKVHARAARERRRDCGGGGGGGVGAGSFSRGSLRSPQIGELARRLSRGKSHNRTIMALGRD